MPVSSDDQEGRLRDEAGIEVQNSQAVSTEILGFIFNADSGAPLLCSI